MLEFDGDTGIDKSRTTSNVDETYPELRSQLQNLDKLYHQFAEWSQCKTIMINVDDEDLEREINELQQQLNLQLIKN